MTAMSQRDCILVFAKAPIPGLAKTRLIPALGADRAAALHAAVTERTLASACASGYAVELWCAPDADHPFFDHCQRRFPVTLMAQRGGDLGTRMAHALESALRQCGRAVVIGTDCPELAPEDLRQAFQLLRAGKDAVLGPAEDGGYWLLGLRQHHPALFANMAWGGNTVLNETIRRLDVLKLDYGLLATWWDLDRPEDLQRLPCGFESAPLHP